MINSINNRILITGAEKRRKVSRGPFTSRFLPLGRAIKDSDDHGIAQIGRLEHATLEAGALVPMHLHQNEEILSYLRKGTMRHEDSHGIKVPIHNKYLVSLRKHLIFKKNPNLFYQPSVWVRVS